MEYVVQYIWKKLLSITHYDHFEWSSFLTFFLVPVVCLLLELLIVGYERSSLRRLLASYKSSQNDIFSFLTHALGLYQLIGAVFTFGIFYFGYGLIQKHLCFHLIDSIQNIYLQFGIMLFVGDFKNYVRHFLLHKFGWSWELHKFHHSANEFTMLTYLRSHAAEAVLTNFIDLFPFIIFGASFQTFVWVYIFREAHQYFIHSQIKSDWGIIGKYILVSPLAHRAHHSVNPEYYGKNLGNTFIIWDRLFGTYYAPKEEQIKEIGLPDNPYNQNGFINDYINCYKRSLEAVIK